MEPINQKIRRSLGGFNRQDVLAYIESLTAAHRREMKELEEELDQSRARREELEEALTGLQDQHGSVAAEEARVRASLEESTRTLARLRGELTQTETKLAVARGELERLQAQVSQLEPMAQKYDQLKDRVATVELDAHRKAQATVDEAKAQAEQLRGEARQWLSDVLQGYGTLRGELDSVFQRLRALGEMEEQTKQADRAADELKQRGGLE